MKNVLYPIPKFKILKNRIPKCKLKFLSLAYTGILFIVPMHWLRVLKEGKIFCYYERKYSKWQCIKCIEENKKLSSKVEKSHQPRNIFTICCIFEHLMHSLVYILISKFSVLCFLLYTVFFDNYNNLWSCSYTTFWFYKKPLLWQRG